MRKIESYETNLLDRAKLLSINIIKFCRTLPKDTASYVLTKQVIRSSTAIGANLVEAQEAISNKDFLYKINHSLKEAKETLYWLEIIQASYATKSELKDLLQESQELVRILVSSVKKLKQKNNKQLKKFAIR